MSLGVNFSLKEGRAPFLPEETGRGGLQKVADFFLSCLKEVCYASATRYHRTAGTFASFETPLKWKENSRGLFVFVHGLRSDPAAWHVQLALLESKEDYDIFAPVIQDRGLCSLDEAAGPLLQPILDYTQKHLSKPICLLGTSNGGRIVSWLEVQCRAAAPETPIKVSIVAGVLFGSKQMDRLDRWGVSSFLYPENLKKELKFGSEKAQELLESIDAPQSENCADRSYEFFATTEDLLVPEFKSSIPELKTVNYSGHIIHGESHGSIVSAVARQQIDECITWMEHHYPDQTEQ